MSYIGSPGSSPPPGPPPGDKPSGAAGAPKPKKPRGVRANLYRVKTHIKNAVVGNGSNQKKKVKTEEKGQKAPTPVPVIVAPQAPLPGLPMPVTQDDYNFQAYLHQNPVLPSVHGISNTPQNPFTMSQPATLEAPPAQSFTLSASVPPQTVTDDDERRATWDSRATAALGTVLEKLAYGKDAYLDFQDLRSIARERKHWDGATLTGWVTDLTAAFTFEELVSIHENAACLADCYLRKSLQQEIARMVVPRQFIRAIVEAGDLRDLDRELALCCRTVNAEYRSPRTNELQEMLPQMLGQAIKLEKLTPHQLYELKVTLPAYRAHQCTPFLETLLEASYGAVIKKEEGDRLQQVIQRSNAGLFGQKT
jgi:hypothetical protein